MPLQSIHFCEPVEYLEVPDPHRRIPTPQVYIEIRIALCVELPITTKRPIQAENATISQGSADQGVHVLDGVDTHDVRRIR